MREDRRLRPERAVKKDLLGGIGDMVSAANDVRDAHVDVINDDAELLHGLAEFLVTFSGTDQNEVFDFIVGKFALAENGVEKPGCAAHGNFEADSGLYVRMRRLAVAAGAT